METMKPARKAISTVRCVDTYCQLYQDLFVEVRADESFKYLQMGLISEIKRKSLPEIAKVDGENINIKGGMGRRRKDIFEKSFMVVEEENNIGKSPQIVKPDRKNQLGLRSPTWQK